MDTKAQALAIFEKHFSQWESDPKRMENGYQYESTYASMMEKVEQEVLQLSVGKVPKDKNSKKKLQTKFGKIVLCKNHIMSLVPGSMNISSLAQETMCYIGQHLVFSEAEEVINNLTGASVNAKQIERVCHQYGQWIEGAMYLTREESWKESKLGRIYQSKDIIQISPTRSELTASTYVTHLGDHREFTTKMDYHLENLNSLVFIADGARWIWKWIEQYYPESIQIVDYYHCKEHLCEFAKLYYTDEKQRNQWIDKFSEMMLTKGIDPVIEELKKLPKHHKTNGKRNTLINYYNRNKDRMQYHKYLEKGLLIGSGAIESAHKDVLQQRLKLSNYYAKMQLKRKFVVHP